MISSIVEFLIRKTHFQRLFMRKLRFSGMGEHSILALRRHFTMDSVLIRALIRASFPDIHVFDRTNYQKWDRNYASIFIYYADRSDADYQAFLNSVDARIFIATIAWKRTTRYSTKPRTELHGYEAARKIKRILFNKRHIYVVTSALDQRLTETDFDIEFEKNLRILNGPVNLRRREVIELIEKDADLIRDLSEIEPNPFFLSAKIRRYALEMSTHKKLGMIGRIKVILDIIWFFTLEGVYVDKTGLNRLHYLSRDKQIVYVPSHRSHADYLMIGYILFKYGLDTPITVAGINLSFFPIGYVFRRCGAIFIRRKFKDNPIYKRTYHKYMELLTRSGVNQMFYIEGGRSRMGKLLPPKFGVLSLYVDFVRNGVVDDLYFAPLSVEYGKLFEGKSYRDELTGKDKQRESMFAMLDTLKYLKKRQGITYVQFAKPFSVRQYLASIDPIHNGLNPVEQLGRSIIHRINSVITITPSSIMSLILLSNTRRGIKHVELIRSCKMIYHYLRSQDVRLAVDDSNFESMFEQVIRIFEYNNYIYTVRYRDADILKTKKPFRHFLDYYKNNLIHLFLPLAFIGTVLRHMNGNQIRRNEVMEQVDFLKVVFDSEFVYSDDIWSEEKLKVAFKFFAIVREVTLDEDVVTVLPGKQRWIEITSNIIRNFMESYQLTYSELIHGKLPMAEKDFLKHLNTIHRVLYDLGEMQMIESNSQVSYRNAMDFARQRKWITITDKIVAKTEPESDEMHRFNQRLQTYFE